MTKKFKVKVAKKQEEPINDLSQSMMTQQEEKMFYANRKIEEETNNRLGHIKRKHTTLNQTSYMNDQEENIDNIQISNLNQTSAQEITEFINKLIAKNKVTSRNAFDIPLIHLEQMEDFRSSLNENTWKRLSSTLENDYKIYGYRVDAAHTITYKMVESIARHQAAGQEMKNHGIIGTSKLSQSQKTKNGMNTSGELLNSFMMETSFNENISKNKMSVDYTRFIQKNQKLLNVTHIQAFFGCNPGLQKTKRKFDQQGLKALLLDNIALRNGCELKLDQHHRVNDGINGGKVKKENIDNDMEMQSKLQQNENRLQFNKIFERIFNPAIPENHRIELENQQNQQQQSIFEKIYELNKNESQQNQDEFKKFQRLYKIISGEEREQKKQQLLRKKAMETQAIIGENAGIEANCQVINNNMTKQIIGQQNNLQNQQIHDNEAVEVQKQEINAQFRMQNLTAEQVKPDIDEITQNKLNSVVQKPQHLQLQSIIPQTILLTNNQQQKQNLQSNQQISTESHPLIDKNFQMHEMNLQRMQQSSESIQQLKQLSSIYTGKFKNIEQYIKLKQQKAPKQLKKPKALLIDDLTSEEIGKKLFNRKYKKKKSQIVKNQHSLKQQHGITDLKKKVDFTKLSKPTNQLKRSVIFKKSLAQERAFNQIKQNIKKNIEQRKNIRQIQEQQNTQKRRKGKKTMKLFDLPIYQFEHQDTNFLEPYEQIDPLTNQLQFSAIFKNHFPTFVQSSCKIIEELKRKKMDKQKEKQELAKLRAQQQMNQQNQMIEENQNNNKLHDHNQPNSEVHPDFQQNQDEQIDISFIGDEMGRVNIKNQVAIRDAKQKVRKIILQMLFSIKAKKSKTRKQKKISFKEIYEAYYRRQGFISPALCFLTMLHLANQHNLVLEGKQDGTDFKIFVSEQKKIVQEISKNASIMEFEPILEERNEMKVAQNNQPAKKSDNKAEQEINFEV